MPITSEQWTLVKAIFTQVYEMNPAERDDWLAARTDVPPTVRNEVSRLLQAASSTNFSTDLASSSVDALSDDEPSLAGETLLHRFEVLQPLGSGSMGIVYSAYDRELAETIALKTLRSHHVNLDELLLALRREVQLARRVRHANVCRLFDLHQDHTRPGSAPLVFFTMELLTGQNLVARIGETGVADLAEAFLIAFGLAAGLAAIHAAGIVHRDLKPGNVFLVQSTPAEYPRPVIADFGVCLDHAGPVTETLLNFGPQAVIGTPAYMAPEQLLGKGATPASDIYALGVILFELVTGRRPFDGETPLAIALRRLKENAPSPREFRPDLPPNWERAILSCLEYSAAKRPASPGALMHALSNATPILDRLFLDRRKFWLAATATAATAIGVATARKFLPARYTPDSRAVYHLKLGLEYSQQGMNSGIQDAMAEFKQAVKIDPRYAFAWANLADAYCMASTFSVGKSKEARSLAQSAAQRAIALDSSLALAHAASAYAIAGDLKHWRSAEPHFQTALRLDPQNPLATEKGIVVIAPSVPRWMRPCFADSVQALNAPNRRKSSDLNLYAHDWFEKIVYVDSIPIRIPPTALPIMRSSGITAPIPLPASKIRRW